MAWVGIATGGGMLLGAVQAEDQRKAQNRYNAAAAENNRYANWTGRTMEQRFGAPSTLGGALQGGLAGFSTARSFLGNGAKANGNATPTTISDNMSQNTLYNNPYKSMA